MTAVDDAPVLNANSGSLAYTENQAATAIYTAITLSDVDSANLTGATVAITGNLHSDQDVLSFTNQNGIAGSYDAVHGILTLSGSSSVANYQAALRSVTYSNTSDNPSNDTRTVSFGAVASTFSVRSRLRDVCPCRSTASTCHVCRAVESGVAGTKLEPLVCPATTPSM